MMWTTLAYFTKEVNQSSAEPPLNFNGGKAKPGLTSWVKYAPGAPFTNME